MFFLLHAVSRQNTLKSLLYMYFIQYNLYTFTLTSTKQSDSMKHHRFIACKVVIIDQLSYATISAVTHTNNTRVGQNLNLIRPRSLFFSSVTSKRNQSLRSKGTFLSVSPPPVSVKLAASYLICILTVV